MIHGVKGFGEIHRHRHRAPGREVLVETSDDLVRQRQESSGGRPSLPEAMLAVIEMDVWLYEGKHQPLQDFRGGAQEGDRSVRRPLSLGLPRFEQRRDNGMFPNVWDPCVGVGDVENSAEIA